MGLSWQQGPLSGVSVGRFLTPEPLPKRLVFAEPLRRRLRVKLADAWIADSEDVHWCSPSPYADGSESS